MLCSVANSDYLEMHNLRELPVQSSIWQDGQTDQPMQTVQACTPDTYPLAWAEGTACTDLCRVNVVWRNRCGEFYPQEV